jgi:POT family proton-dependent oligopeptide transporter
MMGAGYCLMAVHNITVLYVAMFLVILGNGFFKPNISSLLGNLYNNDQYKQHKDEGYNIFYMGINIGAFVCNFFGAALYNMLGWGAAFLAAGVGMFIGLFIFWMSTKHIKHVDVIKPTSPNDLSLVKIFGLVLFPAIVFGLIGYFLPFPLVGSHSTDAFLFGCIPVVIFYLSLLFRANEEDKKPIGALLSVFFGVIVFWAVFHQNGDALTVFAQDHTDRALSVTDNPDEKAMFREVVTYDPAAQRVNKPENDKLIHGYKEEIKTLTHQADSLTKADKKANEVKIEEVNTQLAVTDTLLKRQESWSYFSHLPYSSIKNLCLWTWFYIYKYIIFAL